jgi:hypothetical protein
MTMTGIAGLSMPGPSMALGLIDRRLGPDCSQILLALAGYFRQSEARTSSTAVNICPIADCWMNLVTSTSRP